MLRKIVRRSFLVIIIIFLLLASWFAYEYYSSPKTSPKVVSIEIEKGENARSIARKLQENGILKKTWPFLFGYRIFFSKKSMKAGEYTFELPLSPKDILSKIIEGKITLHPVTIPEGLTRKEIAAHLSSLGLVEEEDFNRASFSPQPILDLDDKALDLEGYLFPETYHFPKGTSVDTIVSAMVSQFKEVFNKEWQDQAGKIGLTIREVVVLASLIEKETSLPEEKATVSAVFHNRMAIGMKLDCDPTIIYALKQEGRFKDRLRTRDLKWDNPYNTYIYKGLPPGPIANPGKESIRAALFPTKEKYLYFVSKNDGSHYFSLTFREHQNAVNKFQRR